MFGMNMEEATIARWHKQPGERFSKGDPLCDIESEKVTAELPAPCDGTMVQILRTAGENAAVGEVVCKIDAELSQ